MGQCRRDPAPLLKHWSYVPLASIHRHMHEYSSGCSLRAYISVCNFHYLGELTKEVQSQWLCAGAPLSCFPSSMCALWAISIPCVAVLHWIVLVISNSVIHYFLVHTFSLNIHLLHPHRYANLCSLLDGLMHGRYCLQCHYTGAMQFFHWHRYACNYFSPTWWTNAGGCCLQCWCPSAIHLLHWHEACIQ